MKISNGREEYPPEHSQEKILRFKAAFIYVALLMAAVIQFVWFPWFRQFAEVAECRNYFWFGVEVNGATMMFYGLFIGIPAMFASIGVGVFLFRGRKILKAGQDPLPGEKVYFPRRYVFGVTAYIKALLPVVFGLFSLGMAFWGYGQAGSLLAETDWQTIGQQCMRSLE